MAGSSSPAAVRLWPCARPLECGMIPPQRDRGSGRLSIQTLKKMLLYTKTKHSKNYPWLSYTVWAHLARSRLHMTDELAWLYFETFDVVSAMEVGERAGMTDMVTKCNSQEELDHLRKKVSVDALQFFLFLFLQNAPKHSLKAFLMTGEEWPSHDGGRRPQSSEHTHLDFLKSHTSDLLNLVSEGDGESTYVTEKGLSALDFAVKGERERGAPQPLTELATLPSEAATSGYSQATGRFSLTQLEQWFVSHLTLSPYGPHAVRSGSRDKACLCFRSDTLGRIAANASLATPTGQTCVLLHKISKQTLAKVEAGLTGSAVHIDNCRSSRLYLLASMKSVHVERCSHCLLVLGAVEVTVTVSNCDSLVVVAACRRLHVSSCSLCNFHLLTATRPVIAPPSHQLTFAPYNTHYPQLEEHLQACGLRPTFNLWDQPLCTGAGENEVWTELDPDLFRPFSIPFQLSGSTLENPCQLPVKYKEALDRRKQRTSDWYSEVATAQLSSEQAELLQRQVQSHFQEWLEATGHGREIRELELPRDRTLKPNYPPSSP